MYTELGGNFEEKLLNVASKCVNSPSEIPDYSYIAENGLELNLPEGKCLLQNYTTSNTYSVLVGMSSNELEERKKAYMQDKLYSKILKVSQVDNDKEGNYPQYQIWNGLIYFENWNSNFRLCVPDSLCVTVISEVHNVLTESLQPTTG